MSYVLEKITSKDQERIIGDAGQIPRRQADLIYARDHNDGFPRTWAIDRERNCYMLQVPTFAREPWIGTYLLFFDRVAYLAVSADLFARRMYFDDVHKPPSSLLAEVTREFVAALEVYGMFGNGPLDKNGDPTEAVMPVFLEKPEGNPWL
jgi:hypothetical protein